MIAEQTLLRHAGTLHRVCLRLGLPDIGEAVVHALESLQTLAHVARVSLDWILGNGPCYGPSAGRRCPWTPRGWRPTCCIRWHGLSLPRAAP